MKAFYLSLSHATQKSIKMISISEFVSVGHPDKVADYISEYLLDRYLERDPNVRYAVEVQIKGYDVTLAGEVTSTVKFDQQELTGFVMDAVNEIGYTKEYAQKWGPENAIFADALSVRTLITEQSADIAQGVDNDGWGDQGIFFGMAEPATSNKMPEDHHFASWLGRGIYTAAKEGRIDCGLDIKVQVLYNCTSGKQELKEVIVAAPVMDESGRQQLLDYIENSIPWNSEHPRIIINGTGSFVKHGPIADCGTTGRKLAVDFYGGNCRIGGGSPWTKDGSKADLTLNLFAREMAVAMCRMHKETVMVQLGCCIGRKEVHFVVTGCKGQLITQGTLTLGVRQLRSRYGLDKPVYAGLCMNGLFGDKALLWETLNMEGI